ncbi:MAG: biopolymer transporter ExbD [Rhodobacteraceae bacterium]|nr:biopolymer transporter ExbD [Paracoccaceae bacterium]
MAVEFHYSGARRIKRRYHQKFHKKLISVINVTPFVDVMLVLLVVFMVTAPLMIVGVPVNLPKTAANFLPNQLEVPLEITLTGTGEYLVMNTPVKLNELISKLDVISAQRKNKEVFLRVDGVVQYKKVAQVIGALNRRGYLEITFVTENDGPLLVN